MKESSPTEGCCMLWKTIEVIVHYNIIQYNLDDALEVFIDLCKK